MNYEEEVFDDGYKELALEHPQAAAALLEEFGEGEWQDSWLYRYPTVKDFVLHELDNGWYFNYKLKYDVDFDGALNLLDFIDYKALGKALINVRGGDCCFETDKGEIITTEIGW